MLKQHKRRTLIYSNTLKSELVTVHDENRMMLHATQAREIISSVWKYQTEDQIRKVDVTCSARSLMDVVNTQNVETEH